jgi:UDP-glucose 4-epimerase
MRVLVTGSAGFIAGYLVHELLEQGHEVTGVDNFSKYGPVEKSYGRHPGYTFIQGDAKDAGLLSNLAVSCDHLVACASRIGGIAYFHDFAYDLLAENERIMAATMDAALTAFQKGRLKKITVCHPVSHTGRPPEGVPTAFQYLRVSEIGLRIFRQGSL